MLLTVAQLAAAARACLGGGGGRNSSAAWTTGTDCMLVGGCGAVWVEAAAAQTSMCLLGYLSACFHGVSLCCGT